MPRRLTTLVLAAALLLGGVPLTLAAPVPGYLTVTFDEPADALSAISNPVEQVLFSYQTPAGWTVWLLLNPDTEDPESTETELKMLPFPVKEIRIRGVNKPKDVHPITVSKDPVKIRSAALNNSGSPAVLTRYEWGADDLYLFESTSGSPSEADLAKGDVGTASSAQPEQRIADCQLNQQNFPEEFAVKSTVRKDPKGRVYRWPLQYSQAVKLLVVHHTALLVRGDPRSPVERVRALYKYHALSKGWGDIGYNFIVDETGQIYEGRAGGAGVVAGHAYCNNTGTIGIVMMGNFEIEQPTQAQVKSLQWLLLDLAQKYDLDAKKSAQFHGKTFDSPIVRHRDLLSTFCPGYYFSGAFSQVIKNVQTGRIDANVVFPPGSDIASSSSVSSSKASGGVAEGITFIGRSSVTINPGGKQRISSTYTSGISGAYEGKKIAEVQLSSPDLKLWVDDGLNRIPVTKGILLPSDLPAYESISVQLIFQAPISPGNYWMEIGGVRFQISVSGRRARTGDFINPFHGNEALIVTPAITKLQTTGLRLDSASRRRRMALSYTSSSVATTDSQVKSSADPRITAAKNIRVRLSAVASPIVTFSDAGTVNGIRVAAGASVQLLLRNDNCVAMVKGEGVTESAAIRLKSNVSDILTVDSVRGAMRDYQSYIECRVVDGALALINELPLEKYLAGLSEEPDTEPYEKQRAFAVAARTYAAYYMQADIRKFPGKPYDGSDDPAVFQSYSGVGWTGANPRWAQAAASTAGQVLKMN